MATLGQYKCEKCGASFTDKAELMEHNKSHSGTTTQYKCATCGAAFKSQKELMEHSKKH